MAFCQITMDMKDFPKMDTSQNSSAQTNLPSSFKFLFPTNSLFSESDTEGKERKIIIFDNNYYNTEGVTLPQKAKSSLQDIILPSLISFQKNKSQSIIENSNDSIIIDMEGKNKDNFWFIPERGIYYNPSVTKKENEKSLIINNTDNNDGSLQIVNIFNSSFEYIYDINTEMPSLKNFNLSAPFAYLNNIEKNEEKSNLDFSENENKIQISLPFYEEDLSKTKNDSFTDNKESSPNKITEQDSKLKKKKRRHRKKKNKNSHNNRHNQNYPNSNNNYSDNDDFDINPEDMDFSNEEEAEAAYKEELFSENENDDNFSNNYDENYDNAKSYHNRKTTSFSYDNNEDGWNNDEIAHPNYEEDSLDDDNFDIEIDEFDEDEKDIDNIKMSEADKNLLNISGLGILYQQVNDYKILTRDEEKEYFTIYNTTIDDEEKERVRQLILCCNIRLVIHIAKKIQRNTNKIPLEDMIDEGVLGLMKAIDKFDLKRGLKFSTYAYNWIKQAITRHIANKGDTIRIPVHFSDNLAKIRKFENQYMMENHTDRVPDEATAEHLKVSVKKIRNFKKAATPVSSLDSPIDENENSILDIIEDKTAMSPEGTTLNNALHKSLMEALKTLDSRESFIIKNLYNMNDDGSNPLTLEEIASLFHLTKERIRQISSEALRKLRHPMKAAKYREFY